MIILGMTRHWTIALSDLIWTAAAVDVVWKSLCLTLRRCR